MSLPKNTPGYAIRAEANIEKIEVVIFSLTLNYIQKLLEMQDDRLPKICFKRLLHLSKNETEKNGTKYNWINQVKIKFLKKINKDDFLDNISLDLLVKEKNNLLEELKKYTKRIDKKNIFECNCIPALSILHQNEITVNYIDLKLPLHQKKILAQVRLLNNYNTRFLTKDKIHKLNFNEYCHLCSERDTIFHSIINCEKFNNYRGQLVPDIFNSTMDNGFFQLLNELNEPKARKIVNFVHIILNVKNN